MDINTTVFRVVQISTEERPNKSRAEATAGKLGAMAGVKSLTKRRIAEIARKASKARWSKYHKEIT